MSAPIASFLPGAIVG